MARRRTAVQPKRLRDQMYEILRGDLQRGALGPGVREADLARRYGVSRTPVREALVQLAREGLLHEATSGGYAAPLASAGALAEARELRGQVDGALAARAATSASKQDRRALAVALQAGAAAHEADNSAAFVRACGRFESVLRSACGNVLLGRVSSMLLEPAGPALHEAGRCADHRAARLAHYAALNEALQSRDAAGAERETRRFADESLCPPERRLACRFLEGPIASAVCGERAG